MNNDLLAAFAECLDAMAAGQGMQAALARYPALADELRPMLEAAQAAQGLAAPVTVPHPAQMASRARLLALAADLRSGAAPARRPGRLRGLFFANRFIALLLVLILGGYGLLGASASSLPGDPLYGLKRGVEQAQLLLSPNPQTRFELVDAFTQRRLDEVRRVLADGRLVSVEFGGLLEEQSGERWIVAGIPVVVPAGTPIQGTAFPGLFVAVAGNSQADGTVLASSVRVEGMAFMGVVHSIGAAIWQVDSALVRVNEQTEFVGAPRVNDLVQVYARILPDGQQLALKIILVQAGPDVTPPPAPTGSTPLPTPTGGGPGGTPTPPGPNATPTPGGTQTGAREIEFTGLVESIGASTWQIGGRIVRITPDTDIRDNPGVGSLVKVRALSDASGLTALRIEPESSGPSPSNTPDDDDDSDASATPPGGATPNPSNTPRPSNTPGSGSTQTPTSTRTRTPAVTNTPGATQTPGVTSTPSPTRTRTPTPAPTNTPGVTSTPTPTRTRTPAPTNTPGVTNTPTATPDPTGTDEPNEEKFEGMVESISASVWIVGGTTVHVDGSTDIRDNPQVGDNVEVRGYPQLDGSWIATRIDKK